MYQRYVSDMYFLQLFEGKIIILNNISLVRQGKNMSIGHSWQRVPNPPIL